jgi:hypothetical protein
MESALEVLDVDRPCVPMDSRDDAADRSDDPLLFDESCPEPLVLSLVAAGLPSVSDSSSPTDAVSEELCNVGDDADVRLTPDWARRSW